MRASSLSNTRIIDLLNSYFVPVHLRNQDYNEHGDASAQEKAERNRIYRESLEAGLPAGTVCAYLLTPDAHPVDVAPLNRPEATNPERLAEKMERVIHDLEVTRGEPLLAPAPQSAPPPCAPDSLVLHLTARYLERHGDDFVRLDTKSVLGTQKAGNWGNLPSEDWIVWTKEEWVRLLPPGAVRSGTSWELDKEVPATLLRRFFPPTENTDFDNNRIDDQSLTARVESVEDGVAHARLEGTLTMKHPFYHKDDGNFVRAKLVGFMDFETGTPRIRSLRLVTGRATYGTDANAGQFFGVAVRSVP
jgi:hypothetical protein